MRIITWNCNMAFRKKADLILKYDPDIVVVPECENLDKLKFNAITRKPTDMLWFGTNANKGLGVFSYTDFRFKLLKTYKSEFKTIVPIGVTGRDYTFDLYAIWANNPGDPDGQYVEQIWKALHHYNKSLTKKQSVLIGDFNSNTIWDKKYREGNHSNIVKRLEKKGIVSCYHLYYKQIQGREEHPTLYLYRHKDKPYHIDYCFASKNLSDKMQSVEIGDHDLWRQHSDHMPVIVTFTN